ncbi:MAG: hypothetical protein ACFB0B_20705 [Thermonemataceae bacterium]
MIHLILSLLLSFSSPEEKNLQPLQTQQNNAQSQQSLTGGGDWSDDG